MSWEPQVLVEDWGELHVFINNTDVTYFRGVPVHIESWSSGDPFSDASAVLGFPQISPFDRIGTGELYWLQGHALVDIVLIKGEEKKVIWEGLVASIEESVSESNTGVQVQCIGALYQLDYYVRAPMYISEASLYEDAIRVQFNHSRRGHLKTKQCVVRYPDGFPEDTGMRTKYTGSWERVLTGYIQRLLADMQNDLTAWETYPETIGRNEVQEIVLAPDHPPFPWGNSYPSRTLSGNWHLEFRGQRTDAIHYNQGASTIKARLEALPNCDGVDVTGSGTASSPWVVTFTGENVKERSHPVMRMHHHELRHDHSVTRVTRVTQGQEETSLETPEPWEGRFTLMKEPGRLPVLQLRDEKTVHFTLTAGQPGITYDLKRDYSQAHNVIYGEGTDEAGTTWRNSSVTVHSGQHTVTAHYPIGWDEKVHPSRRSVDPSGRPTDRRPDRYSLESTRLEVLQKYGGGVSLRDAKRSAQEQMNRESDPGWFGSMTLRSDPEEMSRFEIQAGQNLRLRHFRQGPPPDHETLEAAMDEGLITGSREEDDAVTRIQFVQMLRNALEHVGLTLPESSQQHFTDTNDESVNRMAEAGIARGFTDGTFRPDINISRAQAASTLVWAVNWAGPNLPAEKHDYFHDDNGSPHEPRINRAAEAGLVSGRSYGVFDPREPTTWGEFATMLQRVIRHLGGDWLARDEGIVLHVAEARTNFESGSVELTVDSKARDLLTLAQMIERLKDEERDPAKMLMANRQSSTTDDTKFPWDYEAGSGSLPKESMVTRYGHLPKGTPNSHPKWFVHVDGANHDPYKRWTVVPLVAAGKGTVAKSEIRAYSANGNRLSIPFHVGVYQQYVTAYDMPKDPFAPGALVPDPDNPEALAGYHPSAAVIWGQNGQRAGYWPSLESEGGSPTGILIDEGTWQFQIQESVGDNNILYVAIYAEQTAFFQGRFYHGVQ